MLSSPSKLLKLNENHTLAHSRSSENLARGKDGEHVTTAKPVPAANGHAVTPVPRSRRRNTSEWLSATPKQRRKKAQEAVARHTGDVFFSVHVAGTQGIPRCRDACC